MMGCHTYHFPYGKEDNDNDKNEEGGGICVQYCSFVKIPMLMKSYCEEARKVLQDPSLDVFMKVCIVVLCMYVCVGCLFR